MSSFKTTICHESFPQSDGIAWCVATSDDSGFGAFQWKEGRNVSICALFTVEGNWLSHC